MDAMRAMREARYAKSARPTRPSTNPATTRKPDRAPVVAPRPTADPALPGDVPCGHRAISGRTCTREQGHSAKSHRYS